MHVPPSFLSSRGCSTRRDGVHYALAILVASALLAWAGCSGENPRTNATTTTGAGGSGGSGAGGADSPCGPATTLCGGKCADTSIDPANCGGCGVACAAGEVCSAGMCGLSCVGGATKCGTACVDTNNDPANCGGCGVACAAGEVCAAGMCSLSCAGGATKCGNACVDIDNDPAHCGACGAACSSANATPLCSGGACVSPICNAGFEDCDGDAATGCEVSLGTDVLHCGACGNACSNVNGTPVCSGGACASPMCNAGYGDCDNDPATGCETTLDSSAAHCGACGNACPGGAPCVSGMCDSAALQNQILYNGYYYATLDDAPPSAQYGTWINNCQSSFVTLPAGWSLAPEDAGVIANVIAVNIWSTHCILFSNGVSYGVQTYSGGANCGCSGNQCLEQSGSQYRATSCERRILIRRPQ